jgi:periplasmic divalent cation tolerance protein
MVLRLNICTITCCRRHHVLEINDKLGNATAALIKGGKVMKTNIVYITASSVDEAREIGKELVSSRLAAGANIIENIHSFYWWEGEMHDDREAILIAKTRQELVPELIEKVKSIHSYTCPCIVSIPIMDGYRPFLDWIVAETRDA